MHYPYVSTSGLILQRLLYDQRKRYSIYLSYQKNVSVLQNVQFHIELFLKIYGTSYNRKSLKELVSRREHRSEKAEFIVSKFAFLFS